MIVEIADLGSWGASWLVAEYDPAADAIRIDARAVAIVRAKLGAAEAACFTTVAIAHERFHREHPGAPEACAHAFAYAAGGADPARYESVLRAARSNGSA